MLRKLAILVVLTAVAWSVYAGSDYDEMRLVLPPGDPDAGRQAFLDLSCTSCHAVVGETEFPKPVRPEVPSLGKEHGKMAPGKLASAIVAPSHLVGEEVRQNMEGDLSPMGDFSEAMTVRQLVDLVAYLRSLGNAG